MRVWDGVTWSPIQAAQQRAVLAILLIEAGQVVSTDRLIDEIWGEQPPSTALATVHGYVFRLRKLLSDTERDLLVTRGRGYQLVIAADDLDVRTFEAVTERGRRSLASGDLESADAELTEGLALWRGLPYADVPACPTVAAESTRLNQTRLSVLEDLLGAQIELGRHAEVVDEVAGLARENPLRERLWAHLMLALHRCGRRAEALDAYKNARRMLVDELGIEPDLPLRELHSAILTEDPRLVPPPRRPRVSSSAPAVPAQLPADVSGFTGRADYLGQLNDLLPSERPAKVVIAGTAGVGKTALAVHWGHRVRNHFPDGQLYANLCGYAPGTPLEPAETLGRFLRALGVPATQIPSDVDEAAALYRSLLSERKLLVLLDNASSPAQVRPLVPNSPGCLVLVTSRDRLDGLVALDGAVRLNLGVLAAVEAQGLLALLMGRQRVVASEPVATRLAELCGHLPLALRIAAANVMGQRGMTIADYVDLLSQGGRLAALQVDGDPEATVRAAFDLSYASLPVPSRHLFRLLGLIPGPQFTVEVAATLAQLPVAEAQKLLTSLVAAHLVEEPDRGRYGLHDLLSEYAAAQAGQAETEDERRAATERLYDHYQVTAVAAADRMYPYVLRLPAAQNPAESPFADADDAAAWLDAERANLVAVVTHAAVHGSPTVAWRLADTLRGYLYLRMHILEWRTIAEAGLAAAKADEDLSGQAAAHTGLATLHWVQGKHPEAIDEFTSALRLARQVGWAAGESAALGNLGNLHWALGRLDQAVAHYRDALARHEEMGMPASQATALGNLGLAYFGQGKLDLAEKHYTLALNLHRKVESPSGEARTLTYLGEVYRAQGRLDESVAALEEALTKIRSIGDRNSEGDTLRALAGTYRETGRHTHGFDLAATAVDLARVNSDRRLESGALATRASLHHRMGQYSLAVDGYQGALRIAHLVGNEYLQTEALIGLAAAQLRTGQAGPGNRNIEMALATARRNGYELLATFAESVQREATLVASAKD
ncbi:AfsR/SARP family transcriptional regulator [Rhizocola hellebori]|nr:BTAD domain-containing putative transcriptional regulator [Rhizocola hellebori]